MGTPTINKHISEYNFNEGDVSRIKYIVIHYTGALGDALENCKYFAGGNRGASAHYFVGYDGAIWQSVEDKNIAWHCGAKNYQHADCRNANSLSVELCVRKESTATMSATDKDWYFEDATVNAAAELVRYLMDTYGVPAENVIRHYDVTGKICPNPFVYNTTAHTWDEFKQLIGGAGDIEDTAEESGQLYRVRKSWLDVKSQLGAFASLDNAKKACAEGYTVYDKDGKAVYSVDAADTEESDQDDTEQAIWDFLTGKGLSAYGAAGLMGNLYAESGLNAGNLQNSYNTKLGYTDEEYTAAVDNGSYDNFVKDGAGYGLAQWTYYSRKQALLDYAQAAGASIGCLSMQLAFMWEELQGYKSVIDTLKSADSVRTASNAVLTGYEKPADQSESIQERRAEYGETFYNKYATEEEQEQAADADSVPFKVKVSISDLNIRTGAGTDYAKTGKYTGVGVFTITETAAGKGSTAGWGNLKSGAGWISLDYAPRVS